MASRLACMVILPLVACSLLAPDAARITCTSCLRSLSTCTRQPRLPAKVALTVNPSARLMVRERISPIRSRRPCPARAIPHGSGSPATCRIEVTVVSACSSVRPVQQLARFPVHALAIRALSSAATRTRLHQDARCTCRVVRFHLNHPNRSRPRRPQRPRARAILRRLTRAGSLDLRAGPWRDESGRYSSARCRDEISSFWSRTVHPCAGHGAAASLLSLLFLPLTPVIARRGEMVADDFLRAHARPG
jgi:hypothetical protein